MRGYFMAYGKQTEKRDDARSFDRGGKPSVGFGPRPTDGALGDKLSLGGGARSLSFNEFRHEEKG